MGGAGGRGAGAPRGEARARRTTGRLVEEAERVATRLNERMTVPAASPETAGGPEPRAAGPPGPQAPGAGGRAGARQRASAAEEYVGESRRPRAGRLRDAPIVVFDEATDDPALRFVVVAAALFLIFLVFLLVNFFAG